MPKRYGTNVVLWPRDFPFKLVGPWALYGRYQMLDSKKDIEREKNVTFHVGPKEWKKLEATLGYSRQTVKRWQKKLVETGWISVERQSDGSELVTLHTEIKKNG